MRGNVLVVDDNDEVRDLLCAELEIEGYTVHALNNGAEAVNIVEELKPDAILMDISMPALNGVETTRILKRNQQVQNIPVMMITVSDNKDDIINSFEVGAVDYIKKPV